ncbi:MAG: ribonuclease P protein component [Syntrophomonadaceae bacterium]|jgi:ribonuclease P protein component
MLPKLYRINKSKEYHHTYNYGLKIPGKYLVVYILKSKILNNRFGIVASKRVGNAVKRNRARRRISAIVRGSEQELKQGYNIIIIARQQINKCEYKELIKDFYTVMKKARLC